MGIIKKILGILSTVAGITLLIAGLVAYFNLYNYPPSGDGWKIDILIVLGAFILATGIMILFGDKMKEYSPMG